MAPAAWRSLVPLASVGLLLVSPLARGAPGGEDPTAVERLLELLRSDHDGDRAAAYRALSPGESGRTTAPGPLLLRGLLDIAEERDTVEPLDPPPALAIRLLGEYRSMEAIPILIDRIDEVFPRLVVSAEVAPTEAAGALIAIGEATIEPILDRAETASGEEWSILSQVLRGLERPAALSSAVQGRLARPISAAAQARLIALGR